MDVKIAPDWKELLSPEFEKPYFAALTQFVRQEYATHRIYPRGSNIFRAFDKCPFDKLKVVIIGQDPYHGPGQANGLCFSVGDGVPFPPSLQNIFKEVSDDTGTPIPPTGNLDRWAEQGVLLLNAVLTVRAHEAASHAGHGWETFTDAVVRAIAQRKQGIVYMLWGSYAQKKGAIADPQRNCILKAVHPSPLKGDAFSPIFGRICEINERSIFVEAVEPNEEQRLAAEAVERDKLDLLSLPERGAELGLILKSLGLNTRSLGQDCKTLIINGLNPDPGVTWAEPMLLTHLDNLKAGLEVLRRLSPAEKILLAVPKEMRLHHHDIEVAAVPSQYPASINALVIKAVTGKENPEGVGIVGLHNVWSLGRVARTGLPLIETVVTIGSFEHSGNYIVKEGSTIGELLEFANIELKNGDTLVRGGPLRGESLDKLDRSVTKGSTGVFVVEAGTIPPMEGHSPCINCGAWPA